MREYFCRKQPKIDPKEKGKGILVAKEKKVLKKKLVGETSKQKKVSQQSQQDSQQEMTHDERLYNDRLNAIHELAKNDEEISRVLQEEVWAEYDRLELQKKKTSSSKTGAKKKGKLSAKQADDRIKFIEFLKFVGFNGKQLYPMKMVNLAELYYVEKKKLEEKKNKEEENLEKAVEWAIKMGRTVIHKGKVYNPVEKKAFSAEQSEEKKDKKDDIEQDKLEKTVEVYQEKQEDDTDEKKESEKPEDSKPSERKYKRERGKKKSTSQGYRKVFKRLRKRMLKQRRMKNQGRSFDSFLLKKKKKMVESQKFRKYCLRFEKGKSDILEEWDRIINSKSFKTIHDKMNQDS